MDHQIAILQDAVDTMQKHLDCPFFPLVARDRGAGMDFTQHITNQNATETEFRLCNSKLLKPTKTVQLNVDQISTMPADIYYDTAMAFLAPSTHRAGGTPKILLGRQISEPVQQIPKFRSLNTLNFALLPITLKHKKRKHVKPLGGEMSLNPDLVRLPQIFLIFDAEIPTLGTTYLYEPPKGAMPAPIRQGNSQPVPVVMDDTSPLRKSSLLLGPLPLVTSAPIVSVPNPH